MHGAGLRLVFSAWRATTDITNSVIASEAKQTRAARAIFPWPWIASSLRFSQ